MHVLCLRLHIFLLTLLDAAVSLWNLGQAFEPFRVDAETAAFLTADYSVSRASVLHYRWQ